MGAYTCPDCVLTNGWHFDESDPEQQPRPYRCANRFQTEERRRVEEIVADQHTQAFRAAKEVVRDTAHTLVEFSANDTAEAMDAAQVPSSVRGAAFSWAAREGLIERSGRMVQHRDPATRHRIDVWTSRVFRGRGAGAA